MRTMPKRELWMSLLSVPIFPYQPGLMHGKVFLIDDFGAVVGTVITDNRSFRLDFKLTELDGRTA